MSRALRPRSRAGAVSVRRPARVTTRTARGNSRSLSRGEPMPKTIEGPLGPFEIPETAHPRTTEVCDLLTRQVFEGEYDHPDLPKFLSYGGPSMGAMPVIVDIGA